MLVVFSKVCSQVLFKGKAPHHISSMDYILDEKVISVFMIIATFGHVLGSDMIRHRRFLTPTTYPVPTIPANGALSGNSLMTSVPVRCPLKREVDNATRIFLDENLMRQIYLTEVGHIDQRYLAETLAEARANLHQVNSENNKKYRNTADGLLDRIKQLLPGRRANSNIDITLTGSAKERGASSTGTINWNGSGTLQTSNADSIVTSNGNQKRKTKSFGTNRIKRNADGSVSHVEYCTARGKTTSDGYMRMCSSCAITTVLPDDKFPRYINEVACDSTDCDCFDVRGTAHGKCKVRLHQVKMLRKVPNGCRIAIYNGQQLITDSWEIYDYPLRVGCECVINKLSVFATFIPKPSS